MQLTENQEEVIEGRIKQLVNEAVAANGKVRVNHVVTKGAEDIAKVACTFGYMNARGEEHENN